ILGLQAARPKAQSLTAVIAAMILAISPVLFAQLATSTAARGKAVQGTQRHISGTVTGADGKAVAGAQICVVDYEDGDFVVVASARSAGDGQFMVQFEQKVQEKGSTPPELFAYVPGVGMSLPASVAKDSVRMQLEPAVDAQVALQDSDYKPVA